MFIYEYNGGGDRAVKIYMRQAVSPLITGAALCHPVVGAVLSVLYIMLAGAHPARFSYSRSSFIPGRYIKELSRAT